jgi:hypothetical protein
MIGLKIQENIINIFRWRPKTQSEKICTPFSPRKWKNLSILSSTLGKNLTSNLQIYQRNV